MHGKYTRDQIDLAKELLRKANLPRDALPYTDEFESLLAIFAERQGKPVERGEFWRLLGRAGKEGGAKCGAKAPPAPSIGQDEAFEILRLLPEGIGARDRLPYTSEFDAIHRSFREHTGKSMSKRDFWRVVSRLAKRSRKPEPLDIELVSSGIPSALEAHLGEMNPWWLGQHGTALPPNKRSIYSIVMRHLRSDLQAVIAIRGPRQVGKTTLQRQVIRDMILARTKPECVLRVQFDELPSLGGLSEPVLAIVRWFENKVLRRSLNDAAREGQKAFLFFDEIQNLKAWDSQIKALVDHKDCKVFVTGSSALRIHAGHDSLAGRLKVLDMGPLRLAEVGRIRGIGNLHPCQETLDLSAWTSLDFWAELSRYEGGAPFLLPDTFRAFCEWGGYPYCHEQKGLSWADAAEYLTDVVVKRTVEHDLSVGGVRRDASILKEVFRLAMRYAGQVPKCSTLARELSQLLEASITPSQVRSYLEFLENSLLIRMVDPLQIRLRRQESAGKICICDHGVRAAWLQEKVNLVPETAGTERPADADLAGRVMESVVGYFLAGFEGLGLTHFPGRRDEPEIDYVLTIGTHRIPVEVKYRRRATDSGKANVARTGYPIHVA